MRGFIEELYSKPGQPVPKPGQKMAGNYVRDENEKFWAKYTSLKSLSESRINALVNSAKKDLAKDMNSKVSALDAIVDRVQNGQPIDKDLLTKFIAKGGDPARLADSIKNRIVERNLDYADRQIYNKKMTPAEAHKLEVMKGLLDEKTRQEKQKQENSSAKKIGLFDFLKTEEEPQRKEGTVSDSDSLPSSYEAQAHRSKLQEQRENRQLYNHPGVTGDEIQEGASNALSLRQKLREDFDKKLRMKNRFLTM